MRKKRITLGCALLLALSLCGCQLAREDTAAAQNDRLIGAYITKEHLDLFDMEGYFNDHASSFFKGGEVIIEDQKQYQGRLYATLQLISPETGERSETGEYVFEDLDGVAFFVPQRTMPDGGSYIGATTDNAVCGVHLAVGDNSTSITGTLYVEPGTFAVAYVNPVYQSSDGQVYVTMGSGVSFSGVEGEGMAFTQTMDEKNTITENGQTQEQSFKIAVTVEVKNKITGVDIVQMDAGHNRLAVAHYAPGDLPEIVAAEPAAAYIVVETQSISAEGKTVDREVFGREDESFTGYHAREDGIFEPVFVQLQWK